jgi:multidrug efflux pump subunit AcrB
LILPGHLAHHLKRRTAGSPPLWWPRRRFEQGFEWFRQRPFRRLVEFAVAQRLTTYAVAGVLLLWSLMLVASGRVNFVFFPSIQQEQVTLEVDFAEGTPVQEVQAFLNDMDLALRQLDAESPYRLVNLTVQELYRGAPEKGALFVSFADVIDRPISNEEVLRQWRERVVAPPGIVGLRFTQPDQGPSTNQVNVRLRADEPEDLQRASLWLQEQLRGFGGLRDVGDNMPLGGETLSMRLRSEAVDLGLNAPALAQQVADLTQGRTVQIVQRERDELNVVVRLPRSETRSWVDLQQVPIRVSADQWQPLSALVELEVQQLTQQLNRINGELSAEVTAALGQPGLLLRDVNGWLRSEVLDELEGLFPVTASLEGDEAGQAQFLRDVQFGAVLGLILIFGALAWVFESWLWPFAVLSAIPFALTGAVAGHWIMGIELTVLSVYGLFGLAGIVINNGIVLVLFYRDLLRTGMSVQAAVVEASVQRFRAVVLTTLTTVAGLSFLMFEQSFDAQFLIPVAVGIVFGLLFGTVVMLVLVPALLTSMEMWRERLQLWRARARRLRA